ncbi:ribosomal protein L10e/L16, partial [Jimgerdemannia flammicorona]
MLSSAGTDRLQTSMHGAFGKPQGTIAHVNIRQIIFSVHSKDTNKAVIIEALCHCKYKFAEMEFHQALMQEVYGGEIVRQA